jgi:hypothetical protein
LNSFLESTDLTSKYKRQRREEFIDSRDLRAIVQHYCVHYREAANNELQYFHNQSSLQSAIEKAALATRADGKRFSHQCRIPRESLERVSDHLLSIKNAIRQVRNFESLHRLIDRTISSIPMVGELMIYDTSIRIGAWLELQPRAVYLHAGTRIGAKAIGLDPKRSTIALRELPASLRVLRPQEVEDVLCIYKGLLARRRHRTVRATAPCFPNPDDAAITDRNRLRYR